MWFLQIQKHLNFCILTKRNPRNISNPFHFVPERVRESFRHQRLQKIRKHFSHKSFCDNTDTTPVPRRSETHQCEVHQLDQSSTGHESISQVFDGLHHDHQLKNTTSIKGETLRLQGKLLSSTLQVTYIVFLFGDQSAPPLAGGRVQVHCVPADRSPEPDERETSKETSDHSSFNGIHIYQFEAMKANCIWSINSLKE